MNMKKILLAAVNARYTHSCLALYCLKSYTRGTDAEITIREYSINRPAPEIAENIASARPDAVAFSVYIWNVELIKKILPEVRRRLADCVIILGGPEASYNPGSWLDAYPFTNYVITGRGEAGFRFLVENNMRHTEKIINVPNPPFGEMPLPYDHGDMENLKNRYVYYESSRGCPFQCSYCLSSRDDQKWEAKRPETVMEELAFILSHRPRLLKFVDRTFNLKRERYRKIWNFLIDNGRDAATTCHFEIYPGLLDGDDFAILSRCPKGLFQFEIGVQSTNPETLAAVKRNGNWEHDRAVIERLVGLGTVRVHLDLIAGLPFDDKSSIGSAFNSLYALRPDHIQLGFLKVLPGTEMMERADEFGIVYAKSAPYQVLETGWLGAEDIRVLERVAFLIDRLRNTCRFRATLAAMERLSITPFDLFLALADSLAGYSVPLTRAPESGAGFLAQVIKERFFEKKGFLMDALRRDCRSASGKRPFSEK
ncbi:MAG: hypothetical protein A2W19_13230 [Spirochaetes bacterium RBG_16_49_21]|nr:MAG: hypothetical protein A2W19_13230 [Spirochaetes bacterium RBG_16_49_21]